MTWSIWFQDNWCHLQHPSLIFNLEHDYCHVHLLNTNNAWYSLWISIMVFKFFVGARCVATLLHEMRKRGRDCRFGVISMCIGTITFSLHVYVLTFSHKHPAKDDAFSVVSRYWNGGSCCFWEWWLCWWAMQCPESGWPSFIQGCSLEIVSSYLVGNQTKITLRLCPMTVKMSITVQDFKTFYS